MKLVYKIKNSRNIKTALKVLISIFIFIYTFSISSFTESRFSRFTFLNYGRYLTYLSLIGLFVCVLLFYCFYANSYRFLKLNKLLVIPLFFVVFCAIGTIVYSHNFRDWFTLLFLCFSLYIFLLSFRVIGNKNYIFLIICSAFLCFSLFYIFYYGKSMFTFKQFLSGKARLGTDFDNQNGVAAIAAVAFGFSLYSFLFLKNKFRFLFVLNIIVTGWVGLSTGSRTFLIAAYIIFASMCFFYFKHKVLFSIIFIALTIGAMMVLNRFTDNRLLNAFYTLIGTAKKSDTATISRELYQDYGFLLGSRNLLIGYGCFGFAKYSGVGTYAHNNFAELICNFGLFGTLLFYIPLLVILFRGIRFKRIDKGFIIPFILYYFAVTFTNVFYYKKSYYFVLALLFYLAFDDALFLAYKSRIRNISKVVFTCDSMGAGGAERVISLLSNEMNRRNIKVEIIGVGDYKNLGSYYKLDERVFYTGLCENKNKKINVFKRIHLLRRMIKKSKPDVIISFLPNANIYTMLSTVGLDIPFIVSERNDPYIDPKNKLTRFLKEISFYMADSCVFQTKDAQDYYSTCFYKSGIVIKNPIDIKNLSKYSIPQKRKNIIVAVGRLEKQKNYICLLDAFKRFNEVKQNKYLLHIYGTGSLYKHLLKYCETIGISNNVVFKGNDSEWLRKESNSRMYVLSSDYEGMPNSLMEAMTMGIPSISSDCPIGASRELIQDGVNGLLFPVNDSITLSEKMLMVNKDLELQFYSNNRAILGEYSLENITNQWISLIYSLEKPVYE